MTAIVIMLIAHVVLPIIYNSNVQTTYIVVLNNIRHGCCNRFADFGAAKMLQHIMATNGNNMAKTYFKYTFSVTE